MCTAKNTVLQLKQLRFTKCLFYFDRAFPRRGRWLLPAEAPGQVGAVSGPDGFPVEGAGRAESWSRHSLC